MFDKQYKIQEFLDLDDGEKLDVIFSSYKSSFKLILPSPMPEEKRSTMVETEMFDNAILISPGNSVFIDFLRLFDTAFYKKYRLLIEGYKKTNY